MNLSHHFLISMPQMADARFRHCVIYLLEHNENGAFGVIINNAVDISFSSLLAQVNIVCRQSVDEATKVLRGGPVDVEHGLVLHPPGPTFSVTHDFGHGVSLSSSPDVLEAIASGEEPREKLIFLGHCGWAPRQLELEIADNAWLTCEANISILFKTRLHERRQSVANLLGIDLSNVVGHSGRA